MRPKLPLPANTPQPTTVYLEVLVNRSCNARRRMQIKSSVARYIRDNFAALRLNWTIVPLAADDSDLAEFVEKISVVQVWGLGLSPDVIPINEGCVLEMFVYHLLTERSNLLLDDSARFLTIDEHGTVAATITPLPCRQFDGLWESLVFEDSIKHRLLHFISSVMLFSQNNVNSKIISFNRIILLHGPPGVGKTSLCKALAQKISIRLSQRFDGGGKLIEISAQSLFSKWFSESGKLVAKLFDEIRTQLDDPNVFICALIDEVESLAAARQSSHTANEPTDSLRAVNVLLTELDKLSAAPNLLILTTSNLVDTMDSAFLDRVDMKQFVGPPSLPAIYEILRTCILEVVRCGMITSTASRASMDDLEVDTLHMVSSDSPIANLASSPRLAYSRHTLSSSSDDNSGHASSEDYIHESATTHDEHQSFLSVPEADIFLPPYNQATLTLYSEANGYSSTLIRICEDCKDFGGRTLRRLVLLAHAKYIQSETCGLAELLTALGLTVADERNANVMAADMAGGRVTSLRQATSTMAS
ncbi:P-loop containing nucleoside triphosphate hydrolase protein [Limtongia smithiae]|uniref:P-loop containing nucleoside triphosphate hydrolase protein n=1 Tax=Limtongia smithiae TaxID=1125753 RepID=UPI0034CE18F3